jgi:hypothetical protein
MAKVLRALEHVSFVKRTSSWAETYNSMTPVRMAGAPLKMTSIGYYPSCMDSESLQACQTAT